MATTQLQWTKKLANLICMRETSFACGFTSIERRTIFDLWQMSCAHYAALRKKFGVPGLQHKLNENAGFLPKLTIPFNTVQRYTIDTLLINITMTKTTEQ